MEDGEETREPATFETNQSTFEFRIMVSASPDNANPIIHSTQASRRVVKRSDDLNFSDDEQWERMASIGMGVQSDADELTPEEIDPEEIFGL